jgi:hypothetical protein
MITVRTNEMSECIFTADYVFGGSPHIKVWTRGKAIRVPYLGEMSDAENHKQAALRLAEKLVLPSGSDDWHGATATGHQKYVFVPLNRRVS